MNICIFGDSIAWGANDYEKGGWVERLKTSYMVEGKVRVFNLGVSGDKTEDLLKRFNAEAAAREPDVIIFALGINDSQYINTKDNPRVPLEKFKKNIYKLITKAKAITPKIVFIGLTPIDESKTMPVPWSPTKYYENDLIQAYDSGIREVCLQEQILHIDMGAASFMLADLEDGLHPGPEGHEKMFEIINEKLETLGWFA